MKTVCKTKAKGRGGEKERKMIFYEVEGKNKFYKA